MAKTTKTGVSKPNSLTGKTFPGDKWTGPETDICFYKVKDNYKSDSGYEPLIHVKIDKGSEDTKENTKNMTLQVIKSFDHQGSKVI